MSHRDRHGLTGAAYDSGGGTLDRPASAPGTPAARRRGRARLRQTRLAGEITTTTTAGVGGGAGGGSVLDAGRIAGLRRQKLATQRAASEAAVRAQSAAASASLFGESAQRTADAALAAHTPARGWLRDSSRHPVTFQSRALRRLRKRQRQQLARHCAASEEGMQTLRAERVDFLAQRQDFATPEHRCFATPELSWCRERNDFVRRVREQERKAEAAGHAHVLHGAGRKAVGRSAQTKLARDAAARGNASLFGRQCKYATREGITKGKGVIYAGATGSCSCFKPRPATATPTWSGSRDDAYEESLPIATLLERELGERAGTAASVLEYQYRTVGELRRGWPSAARLLSRHVRDGRELCQKLVASFDSLPLDKFLANAAWDLDWKSAYTVLKCRYSTAGELRRGWRRLRAVVCGVGGDGDALAQRLEASWLLRLDAPPPRDERGWWVYNREGGGVGTGDAELADDPTQDVNQDHRGHSHSHSHSGGGIAMRRRRKLSNKNKMTQSSHSLRPMSAPAVRT